MRCDRILVVEDDQDIRDSLQQVLELEGYQVSSAANGKEGLEALASSAKPCLILLDLMMPVMNGWEFLAVQHGDSRLAAIPVIVVSAAGDRARSTEANGYLKKPIDLKLLLEMVHRYCS